jgi:protein required for attachment to host cells
MSKIIRIPSDALIVVCDAHKALFLTNTGAVAAPHLEIESHLDAALTATATEDSDRPGRRFDGGAAAAMGGARSAMESTDLAARQAEAFAEDVVAAMARRHDRHPVSALTLVAPPTFLGLLRRRLPERLKAQITAELDKDLAEMPLPQLQKVLLASL